MVKFELKRKETGTKTIAMATLNYATGGKVSIALLHFFQRYAWFCALEHMTGMTG